MLPALIWGLDPAPMKLWKLGQGDWLGIAGIAVGLASLQVVLEEGNKDDWFGSPFILRLSIISAVSLGFFIWWELRAGNKQPVVNLRLFRSKNFSFATIANFMLGFVLYASVYLIPIYLAELHGYSARQAGDVMMWTGLPQLVIIPFMPLAMRHFDSRRLLTVGFLLFAVSGFMNMALGPDDSGPQLLLPNLIRAVGQAMVFTPISLIVTAGIEPRNFGYASGLFNMMRNLGGAIGIAVVQSFVTNREKFHEAIINPRVSLLDPAAQARLSALQQYFMARGMSDPAAARQAGMVLTGHTLKLQASYLAYGDAFALLGAGMVVAVAATLFLNKMPSAGNGAAH